MPFRFRFKSLLQQREHVYEEAQVTLARARQELAGLLDYRSRLQERMARQEKWLEEQAAQGIPASRYLAFRDACRILEQELLKVEEEIREADRKAREAQDGLLESRKDLKKIQFLEDKDRMLYRKEELKREQVRMDEIAVSRKSGESHGSKDTT